MVSYRSIITFSIIGSLLLYLAEGNPETENDTSFPEVTLVLFGHTGNGKSTLCNTLIGSNGTSFKESGSYKEETKETIGMTGSFDGVSVCAIDTPGYGGSEGNTARYFVDMAHYIPKHKRIQGMVVVQNYQEPRFDENLRNFFQLITSMYPGQPWLPNLAVVWTRYYPEYTTPEEKNERRRVPKTGIKTFMPDVTDDQLESIPQFFVDSKKARQQGTPDHEELAHLLAWAKTRRSIGEFGDMRVKKGDPIVEERVNEIIDPWHKIGCTPRKYWFVGPGDCHFKRKITRITEQRLRQEYTSGDPTYTEYKEVKKEERVEFGINV